MLERQKQQTSSTLHPQVLTDKPLEVSSQLALGACPVPTRRSSKAQSCYLISTPVIWSVSLATVFVPPPPPGFTFGAIVENPCLGQPEYILNHFKMLEEEVCLLNV